MTDQSEADGRTIRRSMVSVGAAGVGAAAGLAFAGPAGAFLAAAGTQSALELTEHVWMRLGARRRANAAFPIAYASGRLNQPMDEVAERLATDEDLGPIASTVLLGAASTARDDKLFAMGRVLANVLRDRALVDEEQFVASALGVIEAPHIRLLDFIERTQAVEGHLVSQYRLAAVGLGTAFSPVVKTLDAAGLIESHLISETRNGPLPRYQMPGQEQPKVNVNFPHWSVTDLGKLVMARLRQAAEEAGEAGS